MECHLRIDLFHMRQSTKTLTNVQNYGDVFDVSDLSQNIVTVFNIEGKRRLNNLRKLLGYEGVGELKIPGSFLSVMPKITNLPVTDVAQLLDISKSTYYRVKEEDILEMETVDKLSSVLRIYQRGLEAFEDDKEDFEDWLNTKIPSLGNKEPLELLKTENGRLAVRDAIDRIEHSVYG